jgi:hypothetical protein
VSPAGADDARLGATARRRRRHVELVADRSWQCAAPVLAARRCALLGAVLAAGAIDVGMTVFGFNEQEPGKA